jgi:hypothetical protein
VAGLLKIWHFTQCKYSRFLLFTLTYYYILRTIYSYLYNTTYGQFQSRDTVLKKTVVFLLSNFKLGLDYVSKCILLSFTFNAFMLNGPFLETTPPPA